MDSPVESSSPSAAPPEPTPSSQEAFKIKAEEEDDIGHGAASSSAARDDAEAAEAEAAVTQPPRGQSSSNSLQTPPSEEPQKLIRQACPHLRKDGQGSDAVFEMATRTADGRHGEARRMPVNEVLQRYRAGLRYGSQWQNRKLEGQDAGDDDDDDGSDGGGPSRKKRKLPVPSCGECGRIQDRMYLCLECAETRCLLSEHVALHDIKPEPGSASSSDCLSKHLSHGAHTLAFDICTGALYCGLCSDTVYDEDFERARWQEKARSSKRKGRAPESGASTPSIEAAEALCRVPKGLRNLGATCFMNVIIQSFIHNPLLRNYFLSDRHNTALCPVRERCMACELDKLFQEFFANTGDRPSPPFAPATFLFCIYITREGTELSQAGEQDAHELFINALNSMHSALISTAREPSIRNGKLPQYPQSDPAWGLEPLLPTAREKDELEDLSRDTDSSWILNSDIMCPCVVHRTFAGVLQSDVTCQRCSLRSSTHDPILDISLDIRSARERAASVIRDGLSADGTQDILSGYGGGKKGKHGKKKGRDGSERLTSEFGGGDEEQNLVNCLRRYCSKEALAREGYSCAGCGPGSQALKQLSLARLPPVLCIQLKRFEHSATSAKIETRVRFPQILDLREFCTGAVRDEYPSRLKEEADAYHYELFSVAVHEGKLDTGHYYSFVKWRDQWYLCNDHAVRPATLSQVLGCRAYQLCYRRQNLRQVRAP